MSEQAIDAFIAHWRETGGSELANTQSFVNGLCALIGVDGPRGSRTDDVHNDYVFERRVFQKEADGAVSFGRIDAYKRDCFILEAKQGSDADKQAAAKGEADYDIFGQTAEVRVKRGTARRGTPGWSKAMVAARGQAERYAKALPADHGWPPFLLVTDVGHCIDVYADFTGTGKAYVQFPDAARFRIRIDDLRDEAVRDRLAAIWTDPKRLNPATEAAKVTREIADKLAELSKRLEAGGHNPTRVADFLMRCLFTMFAEDVELIPKASFTAMLKKMHARPDNLVPALTDLWAKMDTGGFVGALGDAGETVRRFNGYLFKDQTVIPLNTGEIGLLIEAAEKTWNHVEPAIFGTLLERALDGKERAKLGAHYTPRAYVERLVMPTVIEPLRADWSAVQAAATSLIDQGKAEEARATVERFHGVLAQTKVLDPACGTGNFLYVAMARMKELEGEVVALLTELGDDQYVAELTGHTITPENFLGIEINPRAAAIAQLVLWIGYLQWHFRVNGEGRMPPEPVLRDVRTIENRDALITWDDRVLERDATGKPLTRWDGETMKLHPVTGKKVPDEEARVEVWRYVNPKAAVWPKADFIVGNPPFVSGGDIRASLGDGYFEALGRVSKGIPGAADLVLQWWHRAAAEVQRRRTRRFGLIMTSSASQSFGRRVFTFFLDAPQPVSIVFAIADHPWIDESGSAAVRIAITVAEAGNAYGQLGIVVSEVAGPENVTVDFQVGTIRADLKINESVSVTSALSSNHFIAAKGIIFLGDGFLIPRSDLYLFNDKASRSVIHPYVGGKDLTSRSRKIYIIDVDHLDEHELRTQYPPIYQRLLTRVKPFRDVDRDKSRKQFWWKFGRRNTEMRRALKDLSNYIVTTETSKHRVFQLAETGTLPDQTVIAIALDDYLFLGVLTSRIHVRWAVTAGGKLGVGNDPRYNKTRCFDPFPFPADVPEPLKDRIRAEAEALDALRKDVLARHDDLTLTGLYNVLEALKAGRALTDKERDIHDRGLVTLIRQHHDAIDALVAEAYGWPADLSDEEILTRLVALNKARAAEEAKGLIRWLRPEFQAPGAVAQVNRDLDLGEAPVAAPTATIIPWPKTLAEQISAVSSLLSSAPAPQHPRDIARAFTGKRAATVTPVLDALAAIGQARRLQDGRYAA